MKIVIEVHEEYASAVHQVLKGLQAGGMVSDIKPENKEKDSELLEGLYFDDQVEKTAYDFVEQYRDLVD